MEFLQNQDIHLFIFLSFLCAFITSLIFIPTIVRMSHFKKLFDSIDSRKIHSSNIPRLGGIGIFAGLAMGMVLFVDTKEIIGLGGIVAGLLIIFFVGLKDDILIISPLTKFLGQLIAASIFIFFGDVMITNLHGFFGVHQIHWSIGFPLTLLIFLVTVNAFNFIDGVDGLSASLGIVAALAFGLWFYLTGFYNYAIISLALIGALAGFVRYNVFSQKNKIFMGDTGSMIIGFMLSFLAINFNELNLVIDKSNPYYILPSPAVSFAVMIIPYFDLMRVIYIRLLKKRSIVYADKNHIHHLLLDLGCSHKKITFILTTANMLFIALVYYLSGFVTIRRLLLVILIIAMLLSFIPEILVRKKKKKQVENKKEKQD